jgi:hypothetical protein
VRGILLSREPRNRALAHVVAPGNAALSLAGVKAFAGLPLLVRGEGWLAAEFDALGFGAGPTPRRALGNATAFELGRDAKHGKDELGEIGRGINNRFGNRTQAGAGELHVAGDHQKIGRITREAVNCRNDDNITVREGGHKLRELRPVGGGAGDLLAEHLFAPGRLELGKLAAEVLRAGRDAGIAVNHERIVHQKNAIVSTLWA